MNLYRIILLSILAAACNDPEPATEISRALACDEQAVTWCALTDHTLPPGSDNADCVDWYGRVCGWSFVSSAEQLGSVPLADHLACLDDMSTAEPEYHNPPASCRATWY